MPDSWSMREKAEVSDGASVAELVCLVRSEVLGFGEESGWGDEEKADELEPAGGVVPAGLRFTRMTSKDFCGS